MAGTTQPPIAEADLVPLASGAELWRTELSGRLRHVDLDGCQRSHRRQGAGLPCRRALEPRSGTDVSVQPRFDVRGAQRRAAGIRAGAPRRRGPGAGLSEERFDRDPVRLALPWLDLLLCHRSHRPAFWAPMACGGASGPDLLRRRRIRSRQRFDSQPVGGRRAHRPGDPRRSADAAPACPDDPHCCDLVPNRSSLCGGIHAVGPGVAAGVLVVQEPGAGG
mmetsp:Transcript_39186/g.92069  ORF Transcript_39186/g.92069 Transcript_39186/m.92069 type:complete len:221 (+) Transcript_39186:5733-6395(+)